MLLFEDNHLSDLSSIKQYFLENLENFLQTVYSLCKSSLELSLDIQSFILGFGGSNPRGEQRRWSVSLPIQSSELCISFSGFGAAHLYVVIRALGLAVMFEQYNPSPGSLEEDASVVFPTAVVLLSFS